MAGRHMIASMELKRSVTGKRYNPWVDAVSTRSGERSPGRAELASAMGLDDIERLLRTPEHVDLSPLELKSLVALLCDTGEETGDPRIMTIAATLHGSPVESAPLSEKTAEQLLVALAAENDDPDVEHGGAPLPRADYALVVSIWPASRPTTGMRGATSLSRSALRWSTSG